jgi:hypothetical protein
VCLYNVSFIQRVTVSEGKRFCKLWYEESNKQCYISASEAEKCVTVVHLSHSAEQ